MAADVSELIDQEIRHDQPQISSSRISTKPISNGSSPVAGCSCVMTAEFADPGDFLTTYMGEDPVLVVRNTAGKVGAFLNVCRHRGNPLCHADDGNAASFNCAYHGWTFANDGRLTGVPNLRDAYHGELDRERWGLIPVAQLDSYKGLWFATFDRRCTALARVSR